MNDAPETIWASTGLYYDYVKDWTEGEWSIERDWGVEYRRDDLPATDAQALANPNVQALLSYAGHRRRCSLMSAFVEGKACTCGYDAALAALENPDG